MFTAQICWANLGVILKSLFATFPQFPLLLLHFDLGKNYFCSVTPRIKSSSLTVKLHYVCRHPSVLNQHRRIKIKPKRVALGKKYIS